MFSRTRTGTIIARNGEYRTILLKSGSKIKLKAKLPLGSSCEIAFNNVTGKPRGIVNSTETYHYSVSETDNLTKEEIIHLEEMNNKIELLECSRKQKDDEGNNAL